MKDDRDLLDVRPHQINGAAVVLVLSAKRLLLHALHQAPHKRIAQVEHLHIRLLQAPTLGRTSRAQCPS